MNFQIRHLKKFHCCLSTISLHYQTDSLSSFLSTTCSSYELFQEHFFGNEQISIKKEPITFCKSHDNEVICQLLLWSNHLINPTFDISSSVRILWPVFCICMSGDDNLSQEHLVVSVPCDICKDSFKDTFFKMNKFPKKEPINFSKFYDNEGTTQLLLWSNHFISLTLCYLISG